jgi:4'-phosphopantetheinyl transferase
MEYVVSSIRESYFRHCCGGMVADGRPRRQPVLDLVSGRTVNNTDQDHYASGRSQDAGEDGSATREMPRRGSWVPTGRMLTGGRYAPSAGIDLADNEIHVWHGQVTAGAGPPRGPGPLEYAALSGQERAHCLGIARPGEQWRFAARRAFTRRVLSGYLDVEAPRIAFGRTPCCRCGEPAHGIPCIAWPPSPVTFSVSRSGDRYLVAVARGLRIGIDLEAMADIDIDLMARACLTPAERAYLQARAGPARTSAFYRCWTRKEAVLKACGVGLAGPPGAVSVTPSASGRVTVDFACAAGTGRWSVQDLPMSPEQAWQASLAWPAPAQEILVRKMELTKQARRCRAGAMLPTMNAGVQQYGSGG